MSRIAIVAVALSLVAGLTAQETKYGSAWELLAGEYDGDGDGKVTAEEYTRGAERFQRLDRNRDGTLTAADFEGSGRRGRQGRGGARPDPRAMQGRVLGRLFELGEDGSLTEAQLLEWIGKQDADHDGSLTKEELGQQFPERMRVFAIRALDADGDEIISTAEMKAAFKAVDRNADGTLAGSEVAVRRRGGTGRGQGSPGAARRGDGVPGSVSSLRTSPCPSRAETRPPRSRPSRASGRWP